MKFSYYFRLSGLLLLFIVGIAASKPVYGQDLSHELINDAEFRPVAKAAVDSIYDFRFGAASRMMEPWRNKYSDHPLWMLLESMKLWWQVLSDLQDTSLDESFFYKMKRTDYEASRLLSKYPTHADGLIIKAISNGYIARQYANRDQWISSINQARKALNAHEYLMELQPGLPDLKLAEGLKFYYSAYLPQAYPIVKTVSWALPEGDFEKGLEMLRTAADSAIFARAEAMYFLGNINYHYEDNYEKAVGYFRELYEKYPRNNFYARQYVRSLYRQHRYDDALGVIEEAINKWNSRDIPFEAVLEEELLTWKGLIHENKGDKSEAISSFEKSVEAARQLPDTENRDFFQMSAYQLASIYEQKGQPGEARKYARLLLKADGGSSYRSLARDLLEKIDRDQYE